MTGSNFTDLKTAKEHDIEFADKTTKGCFVSRKKGAILFLSAIAVCVIVGIVVYYAHPDRDNGKSKDGKMEATEGPVTTDASEIDMDVRLSTDLVAKHYDLVLRPDIYAGNPEDFTFTGMPDPLL